ncbi:hypothetical protein BvCmsB39A_03826 [Escherichia coli]|uniref:hypothetical protein n=1 Tax=Escherichia coli TaxID=562 RepID=UPI0010BABF45|nr:hypothetical protein [Escherichia coli]GCK36523.1 hypothetical protein BvCmsB39A_03826 [Escherichia coli]
MNQYELTVATQSADVRPEAAHHLMAVVRAAHEIAREPVPKSSEPLNILDLEQQIEDEF